MYVTNYTQAVVYGPDGTIVHDDTQTAYTVKDTNGNFFSTDSNGNVIDTLGRTLVQKTTSGWPAVYYDVLNSQGTTGRFTVNTTLVSVKTAFGVPNVTEFSGQVRVVSSISLPDSTTYSFTYDSSYGLLASMTLSAGGTVTYGYTNFGASSNLWPGSNRWLTSRTAGSGTWNYTPASATGCPSGTYGCFKVTAQAPDSGRTVYTFATNNGAWNTETVGLATVVTTYDFSNSCPSGCSGSAYIRKLSETSSLTSGGITLNKQTTYAYDSPQNGNLTALKEWNYYTGSPGASPDRETDFTYLTSSAYTGKHIINLVTDRVVKNGAGAQVAETKTSYDSTALTSITGITQHDDTNYGTGNTVRGNPTVAQRWVSGSTYLSTTSYYDTTGQVTKVTDPKGNNTTFSHSDNFFTDSSSGTNPPAAYTPSAPTNAYLTLVTLPISGSKSYGYYFGDGRLAVSTDQNGQSTYQHYDSLNRLSKTASPDGGWSIRVYSATEEDVDTAFQSSGTEYNCAIGGASICRDDQLLLDSLARPTTAALPDGPVTVQAAYDPSGRLQSITNPYYSTSDPTYGLETYSYDTYHRVTQVAHTDGSYKSLSYGGTSGQLCSSATYGLGYVTWVKDEVGNVRQSWADGFGRTIEVDEPDASNNLTVKTCYKYDALNNLTEVDQGSQTRTYSYDGLSRLTASTTPESGTTNLYYTTSGGSLCAAAANALCRRTDARGITTTYAYDALSRLTSKTYSNGNATAYFYYDESSVTVAGTAYTLANTKGRLSHTSAASGTALTLHSYDPMGRTQDLWQCTPYNCGNTSIWKVHYSYDWLGDVTSWTHPAGFTISEGYDNLQRLGGFSSSWNDATHPASLAGIIYSPAGPVASVYNGCVNSATCQGYQYSFEELYDYNNRVQLVRLQNNSFPFSTNSCWVYNDYVGVGNPTSCTVPSAPPSGTGNNGNVMGYFYQDGANASLGHTATYTYDHLNRLGTSVATGSSTHNLTFSYDRYGNMTCVTNGNTNGPCPNWAFNTATNQITNSGFTYDAAGDLTGDGTHTYEWNAEGRLKSVDSGNTATYVYNALGWRVEKKVGSAYTEVLYDQSGESLGENNRTAWTQSYVNFAGRHVAIYANNITYFPHANSLGSTVMVSDYTGAIVEDKLFYPWGQDWQAAGTLYEERFAKLQHRDSETSLDPTPNRMFSSNEGRWLSPDPFHGGVSDPQSLNRYAYVLNNPATLTDPLGLFAPGPCIDPNTPGCQNPFIDEFFFSGLFAWSAPPVNPDMLELRIDAQNRRADARLAREQKVLDKAVAALLKALAADADCLSFLNARGAMPLATLRSLPIDIEDLGPAGPAAETTWSYKPDSPIPQDPSTIINAQGAFFDSMYTAVVGTQTFNGNTPQARALILLHELGHATGVLPADNSSQAQAANNAAVVQHCSKTIAACGGN